MKIKTLFMILAVATLVGFFAMVVYLQQHSLTKARAEIANHASIISRSLWNFEPTNPTAYLTLAATANNYERVSVRDEMGDRFLEITHTPASGLDNLFVALKLMPSRHIGAPVQYQGVTIGSIEAVWVQKTIYTYIYTFFCLVLVLVVSWLFLKLFESNRTLEDKVRLRTTELVAEVAERRSAEERAVAVSQRLSAHQQQTPVGLIEWDLNLNVVEWNPAAETIFGYSREEALGRSAGQLIIPEHAKTEVEALWQELLSQTGGNVSINDNVTKGGAIRICEWRNTALRDDKGEVIGVGSFVQDISERRITELEVRRLRNYLSNIIDAMPSILVGVDHDQRVTLWNQSAETATGVPVAEALGRPMAELLPQLSAEARSIQAAMAENRIRRDAKIPRQLDGRRIYEDVTIFPLEVAGEKGAVIRIDDVTEQVRMEATLVQSEKMLSVGGLAAGMAHEINNPLAGMMQSVSVIQQRFSSELPANTQAADASGTTMAAIHTYMDARGIRPMLATIHREGQRAAKIVQNMLSFARKRDDQWSSQDLAELLDAAVELAFTDYDLKKKYDFRFIDIVREYAAGLPPVPCEKQMIQQVFLNILRNGAEAMQAGGGAEGARFILRVRGGATAADGPGQQDIKAMVCVEIEDNGPGMDDATRRRVFEPFFTTKPVGVGTGLGLSVSYFIITENHNGSLRVEAVPQGGTRFVVCLPVSVEADGMAANNNHPRDADTLSGLPPSAAS